MSVVIEGLGQLVRNLQAFTEQVEKEQASAQIAGGKLVETETKKLIANVSQGNNVKRSREGGGTYDHIASKDGDAPNTDTGRLISSITTEVLPQGVFVGTSVEYAPHLEFGTVDMEPRPFLFPAFEAKRKDVMALIAKGVKKAVNNAGTN